MKFTWERYGHENWHQIFTMGFLCECVNSVLYFGIVTMRAVVGGDNQITQRDRITGEFIIQNADTQKAALYLQLFFCQIVLVLGKTIVDDLFFSKIFPNIFFMSHPVDIALDLLIIFLVLLEVVHNFFISSQGEG